MGKLLTSTRLDCRRRPGGSRFGGAVGLIMLLVVLAVMLILTLQFFQDEQPVGQVQGGMRDIEKAGTVACSTNRMAFKTNLAAYQVENMGAQLDVAKFRSKYNLPSCPRGGGIYLLGPDGDVYCTKHNPPPAAMLQQMIALTTPTPVPTPFLSPTPLGAGAPAGATPTPEATLTPLP